MTMRQKMLEAASRGRARLTEPQQAAMASFLRSQQTRDGGFADRAGQCDLYYTVFGLEALQCLGAADEPAVEAVRRYLRSQPVRDDMDLVELSCLARCWADAGSPPPDVREAILARVDRFHCGPSGFSQTPGFATGNVFGSFLALGLLEDLAAPNPYRDDLLACLASLKAPDGSVLTDHASTTAATPGTAAALCMLDSLGQPIDPAAGQWLLSLQAEGAFFAVEGAPVPDLLSTAVSLHALDLAGIDCGSIADDIRAWTLGMLCDDGGFRGTVFDSDGDCEYTFYGLLALGHLG